MPLYEVCPEGNGPMGIDALAILDLLIEAFPSNERPCTASLEEDIRRGRDAFMLRKDTTGTLEGVLSYKMLGAFVFVDYFATTAAVRGQGIGGEMLDAFIESMPGRIVLEVELPMTDTACRRVGFYERHGFVLNEYDYAQPALREGCEAIPMRLMSYQTSLDEIEFEYVKEAIYREVYGL